MLLVKNRWIAFVYHIFFSSFLVLSASALIFGIWYPDPFSKISGGIQMFVALVVVDLVIGPLLTLVVFSKNKTKKEIVLDIFVILILQLAAMCYGVWSLASARPAYLVYEYGRYSIVREMDLEGLLEKEMPSELKRGYFSSPRRVALRPFRDSKEQYRYTMDALAGVPLAFRSELWRPYEELLPDVRVDAKPVTSAPDLQKLLNQKTPPNQEDVLYYLPLQGAKGFWSVILNEKAEILDFVEWDPL